MKYQLSGYDILGLFNHLKTNPKEKSHVLMDANDLRGLHVIRVEICYLVLGPILIARLPLSMRGECQMFGEDGGQTMDL